MSSGGAFDFLNEIVILSAAKNLHFGLHRLDIRLRFRAAVTLMPDGSQQSAHHHLLRIPAAKRLPLEIPKLLHNLEFL
jgi:hypothetical protein